MSEQQIPAGWYPDPVDTDSDPRPQRWWDGTGWTAETRPAPAPQPEAAPTDAPPPAAPAGTSPGTSPGTPSTEDTAVLEGTVLDASGQTVSYPPLPPYTGQYGAKPTRDRAPKPVLVAASVAAVLGLAIGSGVTYLAMDGRHDDTKTASRSSDGQRFGGGLFGDGEGGEGGNGGKGGNGSGGGNSDPFGFGDGGKNDQGNGQGNGGGTGKNGKGNGNGNGGGTGTGKNAQAAVDMVNGISLPIPGGWDGGTTAAGYAALSIGSYTCVDGSDSCSLGGVSTGQLKGNDAKKAAQDDIATAAKEAYGDLNGHQELKSEAVTVAGQSGYLVRWKVDAAKGNPGYVETVVFPTADGKALTAVHFGFDIADKAPGPDQMDTIVKGITKVDPSTLKGGTGGAGTTT
ncbi:MULTISPECIES: DUF2510 domain-containing protein [Kitasatospora]|uniref:Uncharacterized protein n=1 Tax=Kitasatospora setae (strain ATCC 33774 / DSM 43861 / JCM 3304 / KCC A-0304 / NBRC 14216 / KM-6054) TaxID=452652 RepID=E4N303_KITSK|nr:DUF2510 domain-containing protein [Kitasatospora setae]BAJ32537.1 hypothetical protein KSE_67790 [Kitasatospora setae KM-6054]